MKNIEEYSNINWWKHKRHDRINNGIQLIFVIENEIKNPFGCYLNNEIQSRCLSLKPNEDIDGMSVWNQSNSKWMFCSYNHSQDE